MSFTTSRGLYAAPRLLVKQPTWTDIRIIILPHNELRFPSVGRARAASHLKRYPRTRAGCIQTFDPTMRLVSSQASLSYLVRYQRSRLMRTVPPPSRFQRDVDSRLPELRARNADSATPRHAACWCGSACQQSRLRSVRRREFSPLGFLVPAEMVQREARVVDPASD